MSVVTKYKQNINIVSEYQALQCGYTGSCTLIAMGVLFSH